MTDTGTSTGGTSCTACPAAQYEVDWRRGFRKNLRSLGPIFFFIDPGREGILQLVLEEVGEILRHMFGPFLDRLAPFALGIFSKGSWDDDSLYLHLYL